MSVRGIAALLVLTASAGCPGPKVVDPSDSDAGLGADLGGECGAPRQSCGDACVDSKSDPAHCGSCFAVCGFGTACSEGACVSTCGPRQTDCSGACADLEVSVAHCGACEAACRRDQVCSDRACACPRGLTECSEACVDLESDALHCGGCNMPCGDGERCVSAQCICARATREEVCTDGEDDDCDGAIDCEDLDCLGATRSCSGACGPGVERCGIAGRWGSCEGGDGSAEICGDGVDQDCSGEDLRAPDRFEPNDACASCFFIEGTNPRLTLAGLSFDSVEDGVDCFSFEVTDGAFYREFIEAELLDVPAGHDYGLFLYQGEDGCRQRDLLAFTRARGGSAELRWGERFLAQDRGRFFLRVVRYAGQDCEASYRLRVDGLR